MSEWILPCNPNNYRINDSLREMKIIEWFQTRSMTNMEIGDIVYIYVSSPVNAICWKCKVNDVQRMTSQIDDTMYSLTKTSVSDGPFVEIEVLREYKNKYNLSLEKLRENGLNPKNSIQGPFRIKPELEKYLYEIERLEDSED